MGDRDRGTGRSEAATFGRHVRRQRLALDLTQVALAGRVGCSSATIKKIEHDQRRPSRQMATRLAEALDVPASQQGTFVDVGVGERPPRHLPPLAPAPARVEMGSSVDAAPVVDPLPDWLVGATDRHQQDPLDRLVGRDVQLARLDEHLDAAVDGQGRVVFVAGEAGQGKTALLTAFASRAQAKVPDLVAAMGHGTAVSGAGDPYLPFRDLLLMLLVDPQARWQADRLPRAQIEQLWRFAPHVARTLLSSAHQLLDVLVPAATVHARADAAPKDRDHAVLAGELSRERLVSCVTETFQTLARERPLLIMLDDLQWVDVASAELLFHLSRRLRGSRILVVGALRGSEVGAATDPAGRLVRRTQLEVGRDLEGSTIDLEAVALEDARGLCSALLERESVRLDPEFSDRLFWRTRGQPLFVLELVRELRERGALVRGSDGTWSATAPIDWSALPARISAVIEQRLARLTADARAVLDVAAVLGEHFVAEVVAQILGEGERTVLRLLAHELGETQGLVRETGTRPSGGRWLSRWRFGHVVFQQYLYHALSAGERRHLHRRAAAALTELVGSDDDAVVPDLAHHHAEAGDAEEAVTYLLRAGDRARALYASDEAAHHYDRAATFLRRLDDPERLARTLMKLGLTYQTAFDHERAQQAYDDAFRLWRSTSHSAAQLEDAPATLRMIWRDPPSLDPTLGGYNTTAPIATQLFSGLVSFGADSEVLPDVAARWELEDDGRRYVFHLRDDVVWSDGVPVTAHDFVFTYRRALDPATGATTASSLLDAVRGARAVRAGTPIEEVDLGIRDDGHRTFVLELEEPTSYFIQNLAYYVLLPVPRHVVGRDGDGWAVPGRLVGNGPYLLESWESGRSMTLARNPRYHGAMSGNVGRIDIDLASPEDEHEQLYDADRLDVLRDWFTPATVLARLSERYPEDAERSPGFTTMCYAVVGTRPPLDDPQVRRALAAAVDRPALARSYPMGLLQPAAGGIVPVGMPGYVPDVQEPYDPELAARLLAAAGADAASDGREVSILTSSRWAPLAEALCDGWRAIGLRCNIEVSQRLYAPPSERSSIATDISMGGWIADYADPDNFLRVFVEMTLATIPATYRELLTRAARTTDQGQRLAIYAEAERFLAEDASLVPLGYLDTFVVRKPWVHGLTIPSVKHVGSWKDVTMGRTERPTS